MAPRYKMTCLARCNLHLWQALGHLIAQISNLLLICSIHGRTGGGNACDSAPSDPGVCHTGSRAAVCHQRRISRLQGHQVRLSALHDDTLITFLHLMFAYVSHLSLHEIGICQST